jgi:hypothetical protein
VRKDATGIKRVITVAEPAGKVYTSLLGANSQNVYVERQAGYVDFCLKLTF